MTFTPMYQMYDCKREHTIDLLLVPLYKGLTRTKRLSTKVVWLDKQNQSNPSQATTRHFETTPSLLASIAIKT